MPLHKSYREQQDTTSSYYLRSLRQWLDIGSVVLCVMMCLAVISVTGCKEQAGPPPQGMPEVAVVTVEAKRAILTTELTGRTAAFRIAEIRPQVNGLVQKRLFTEGKEVEAGQVLYQIDPAPFKAEMNTAQANLAVMRGSAERAQTALAASEAVLAQQQATLELAKLNRDRFIKAVKTSAVSVSERDRAVTEATVAEAGVKAAEAQVESDRAAIAVAKAGIQQAEAAMEIAKINLGYTKVTAPISGRIGRSAITDGAMVTAYQPLALASIQQLDPIYVDVTQSTTELLQLQRLLKQGNLKHNGEAQNKVKLILKDGTQYALEGTLQFQDVTVDPTTGSVILRVVFPNPEGILLPGMFVRTVIVEGVQEDAILVPQQTVARTPKGEPIALVVDAENTVQQRMLTLDREIDQQWLVTSGLEAGDRIIIEGSQRVRPGTPVNAVPFGAEKPADSNNANESKAQPSEATN